MKRSRVLLASLITLFTLVGGTTRDARAADVNADVCAKLLLSTKQMTERYREFAAEDLSQAKRRTENVKRFVEVKLELARAAVEQARAEYLKNFSYLARKNPFHTARKEALRQVELLNTEFDKFRRIFEEIKRHDETLERWISLPFEVRRSRFISNLLNRYSIEVPVALASASLLYNLGPYEISALYNETHQLANVYYGQISTTLVFTSLAAKISPEEAVQTYRDVSQYLGGYNGDVVGLLTQAVILSGKTPDLILTLFHQLSSQLGKNHSGTTIAILTQAAAFSKTSTTDTLRAFEAATTTLFNYTGEVAAHVVQSALLTRTPVRDALNRFKEINHQLNGYYALITNTVLQASLLSGKTTAQTIQAFQENTNFFQIHNGATAGLHLLSLSQFVPEGREKTVCLMIGATLSHIRSRDD